MVFGPKYKSFKEAVDLVALEGAFPVDNPDDLNGIFDRLVKDEAFREKASKICKEYVAAQSGATDAIMHQITSIFSV